MREDRDISQLIPPEFYGLDRYGAKTQRWTARRAIKMIQFTSFLILSPLRRLNLPSTHTHTKRFCSKVDSGRAVGM
jgi:hypothetical protein